MGLIASAACLAAVQAEILSRISFSLALGALVAAVAQAAFYLGARRSRVGGASPVTDPEDPTPIP